MSDCKCGMGEWCFRCRPTAVPEATAGLQMRYFVLKPKGRSPYATASRSAMKAYADAIRAENPALADELSAWARRES